MKINIAFLLMEGAKTYVGGAVILAFIGYVLIAILNGYFIHKEASYHLKQMFCRHRKATWNHVMVFRNGNKIWIYERLCPTCGKYQEKLDK